jgi:hypothetical protein
MSIRSIALKQSGVCVGGDHESVEQIAWPIRDGRDAAITDRIGSDFDLVASVRLTEEAELRLRVLAMLVRTLESSGSASRLSALYRGQATRSAGQRAWAPTMEGAKAFIILDSLSGRFVNDGIWRWIAPAKASGTARVLAEACAAALRIDTLPPGPAWPDSFRPHRVALTNWPVRLAAAPKESETRNREFGWLLRVIAQDRREASSSSLRLLRATLALLPPRIKQLLVAPHLRSGACGDDHWPCLDELGLIDALSYRFLWPLSPVAFLTPRLDPHLCVGERQRVAYDALEADRLVPLCDLFPGGLTVGLFQALANAAFGDVKASPRLPWTRDWRSAWATWLAAGDATAEPILLPQGGFRLGIGGGRLSDDPLGGNAAYRPPTVLGFAASPFTSSASAE